MECYSTFYSEGREHSRTFPDHGQVVCGRDNLGGGVLHFSSGRLTGASRFRRATQYELIVKCNSKPTADKPKQPHAHHFQDKREPSVLPKLTRCGEMHYPSDELASLNSKSSLLRTSPPIYGVAISLLAGELFVVQPTAHPTTTQDEWRLAGPSIKLAMAILPLVLSSSLTFQFFKSEAQAPQLSMRTSFGILLALVAVSFSSVDAVTTGALRGMNEVGSEPRQLAQMDGSGSAAAMKEAEKHQEKSTYGQRMTECHFGDCWTYDL